MTPPSRRKLVSRTFILEFLEKLDKVVTASCFLHAINPAGAHVAAYLGPGYCLKSLMVASTLVLTLGSRNASSRLTHINGGTQQHRMQAHQDSPASELF